jgi:hypothetical protein
MFEYDQRNEAEVDAWLQEVLPRLQAHDMIPLGDVRETEWELFCPEYFSQYIGWDVWWLGNAPSMSISLLKPSKDWPYKPFKKCDMTAELTLISGVAPEVCEILPFRRPEYASLEPIKINVGWRESGLKLWFLGNGMLRLEMDT